MITNLKHYRENFKLPMEWIIINDDSEVPTDQTIIVEDIHGWIGQAYRNSNNELVLETFGQISREIKFDKIVRYLIIS